MNDEQNVLPTISPLEALKALVSESGRPTCLDVRSEGEFAEGNLPYFSNGPILNNSERHQVGLMYKNQGQAAAIQLASQLVEPFKSERVQKWKQLYDSNSSADPKDRIIICWRGGLRSKTAQEWLVDSKMTTLRVQGGYKAIRNSLRPLLETPPSLLALSGFTGSSKTRLLNELNVPKIDLEGLAQHRGSSFGLPIGVVQPTQSTFENRVALELFRFKDEVILVEDESRGIGAVYLSNGMKDKMRLSPVVLLESPVQQRATAIFEEYVASPINAGHSINTVKDTLQQSLLRISKKLGGLLTQKLLQQIEDAFAQNPLDISLNLDWIQTLLEDYYDKLYLHALERHPRQVVFQGDYLACKQWITENYASRKLLPKVDAPQSSRPVL